MLLMSGKRSPAARRDMWPPAPKVALADSSFVPLTSNRVNVRVEGVTAGLKIPTPVFNPPVESMGTR